MCIQNQENTKSINIFRYDVERKEDERKSNFRYLGGKKYEKYQAKCGYIF